MYDFYDELFNEFLPGPHERGPKFNFLRSDVIETDDGYILKIDIPGVKKENIKLNYNNKYLTVSYKETKEEVDNKEGVKYLRRERRFGNFSRSYLFDDIDSNSIEASYNDGVLEIKLNKKKYDDIKAIEIK